MTPIYTKNEDGTERWTVKGILHREDGPAIISRRTWKHKEWYVGGKLHRVDGPAITSGKWFGHDYDYYEKWYINNKFHRVDGPAMSYTTTRHGITYAWALDDKQYSFNEWLKLTLISEEKSS